MTSASAEQSNGVAGPAPDAGRPADTTGARLAAARIASGRDLAAIAQETRVSLRYLRAIEEDRHDDLPALPYALGFVRSFARAVGLDPEATAARFRSETSKAPHVPSPIGLERLDEQRLPSRGTVASSLAALALVLIGLSAWGAGLFDAAPVGVGEAPPAAPPVEDAADEPPPAAPASQSGPPESPPVEADARVVLLAEEEVWVRIYEPKSRTVALSGILKPGDRFEVPAEPPGFRLWTGKAGALQLRVGGRVLPPLGGPAEVLKDVSLAPEDLVARPPATSGAPAPETPRMESQE